MSSGSNKRRFQIPYEAVIWILFGAWALFCVLDRFIGPIYLGSPNGGFLPPPCFPKGCLAFPALRSDLVFSLRLFDGYQRATGRLFVAVTPFLIILETKVTENWFAEHHPRWLNIGDIRATNNRLHYMMAFFFLAVPMIPHLFSIFVPVLADGIPLRFLGFRDVAADSAPLTPFIARDLTLFFKPEDWLRFPLALLTFVVILPLSVANRTRLRNFTVAHYLHLFGAAIYFMDFLRGNHPHAQVMVAPIFIWYFVDRMIGIFVYRTGRSSIIHIENVDDEYCVVFLYIPQQKRRRAVGSLYYYQMPGLEGAGDFSHPYTSFQNHGNHPLLNAWRDAKNAASEAHQFVVRESDRPGQKTLNRRSDQVELEDFNDGSEYDSIVASETEDVVYFQNWNTAFVMQKFPSKGGASFSKRLSEKAIGSAVNFWGPYYSEYASLTPLVGLSPLVLIATGAGVNYMLDYFTWLTAGDRVPTNPVQLYFSCSSIPLLQFATDLLCSKNIKNFSVSAHLTRHNDELAVIDDPTGHEYSVNLGRLSLEQVVERSPKDAQVYFCGSPDVQWKLELICAEHNRAFHPGSRFSPHATREIHYVGGRVKCKCTGFPL